MGTAHNPLYRQPFFDDVTKIGSSGYLMLSLRDEMQKVSV